MLIEENDENEIASGWPFGLGNMHSRIRAQTAAVAPPPPPPPPNGILIRTSSFSSFSSSNLDTESTASFFPDQSVSLGRLIGFKPVNKGNLCYEQIQQKSDLIVSESHGNGGQGLCAPLLYHVIGKIGRSGSIARH